MRNYTLLVFAIALLGTVSLLLLKPSPVGAGCLPNGTNQGEEYQPCVHLRKEANWFISWPCSSYPIHNSDIDLEGAGFCSSGTVCCDSTQRVTECWPLFNSPVTQNGLWRVTVNNRATNATQTQCNGGCSPASIISCVTVSSQNFEVVHDENCNHECVLEMCEAGCAWDCDSGQCVGSGCASPVLIDVAGDGFDLTHSTGGVTFDLNTDGDKEKIAWTATTSDDAWLTLDRNGNGTVDNGAELFGNYTPQTTAGKKNGFLALAEFDKQANGGNHDGVINSSDSIFSLLRLWQDTNHNGISESSELKNLDTLGLVSIDLNYSAMRKIDEYGNRYLYRTKVADRRGSKLGRWAWDVFLVQAP